MKYYSQYGQDVLLNQIFKDKKNGFFVEVGCIDGKRFSNTLQLEKKGWKGMCVEAHTAYIDLLKENRPNSIICHCAAGEKNEDNITFYANSRGSLSTLDKTKEEHFKERYKEYFTGWEKQKIKKRRLDYLFKKHNISEIDVLSLDIEGYEIEALKGLNFNSFKPRILIVEIDSKEQKKELEKIIKPFGYKKACVLGSDIFYTLSKSDLKKIKNVKISATLNFTKNPFDKKEKDLVINKIIDTRFYSYINMRKFIIDFLISIKNILKKNDKNL